MRKNAVRRSGERGIALVMALLVLVVLSLLAVVIMTTVSLETKVAGHGMRESAALNIAEAGVGEAVARIRIGDIDLGSNPKGVGQIYNVAAGSVPPQGVDSVGVPTAQPAGAWLNYTTSGKTLQTLTVKYKTDAARTVIYKYDPTLNPPIQTGSGYNIYVITSTGRKGADSKTVVTEVIEKPVQVSSKGALAAGSPIDLQGNMVCCGYNHDKDTPDDTGTKGRTGNGGCNEDPAQKHWELGTGDLTGAWGSSAVSANGTAGPYGAPATAPNQPGFFNGPWEVLGLSQSEFFSWVGAARATAPATPAGLIYLDNDATHQNQSGSYSYGGVSGDGLLYVDGDLSLNSSFHFRGLIYVEGDLHINGQAWILGGLVVRGKGGLQKANGGCTVLYSMDAIRQNIWKYGGQFVTLSWREL